MKFGKFNCFYVNFLRYSFGRIKIISTVVELEYTTDIMRQMELEKFLYGFYMIRCFAERYRIYSKERVCSKERLPQISAPFLT